MVKFKVLKYNEYILIQLGIFSDEFSQNPSDCFFKLLKICYILLISGSFVISGSLFAYQNAAQFTVALRTCAFTCGAAQAFGMLFCFGLNTTKVRAVHHKLQALADKSTKGITTI